MGQQIARISTISALPMVLCLAVPLSGVAQHSPDAHAPLETVAANDNREPGGELRGRTLHLSLRAAYGAWAPEGPDGPPLQIEAFGELGGPLTVPAPLVRVPEGTSIAASIRNDLPDTLRVHGLCARDGSVCAPVEVRAGETRKVSFTAGLPGTYHYWATTTGMPVAFRGSSDSQLSGAYVVDAADSAAPPDRVLVITEWTSLTRAQLAALGAEADPGAAFLRLRPAVLYTINGLAWPHTEQLSYAVGEPIHWRIVNLSTQPHPMHLHGFYFDVERQGDGARDEIIPPDVRPRVVTHLLPAGATVGVRWVPERPGRWLFHCHTMVHVSPTLHVDGSPRTSEPQGHAHERNFGMRGLVLGIEVRGRERDAAADIAAPPQPRQITLVMRSEPRRFGDAPAFGFQLGKTGTPPAASVPVPGPILVLRRGEPVEIELVNRLPESTSIHWHGMELDSYYDGVHGWSGTDGRVAPEIASGETFVVRFTPPRAGTFIYHTHLHDNRQLTSGLYGALLVVEPDEPFDETRDHVFVIARGGPALDAPVVVNGRQAPLIAWTSGERHRVRVINITPNDTVSVSLRTGASPVSWQVLAKDGSMAGTDRDAATPAVQVIGVGETYDFEYVAPPGRRTLWLEVRTPGGKWLSQGQVVLR